MSGHKYAESLSAKQMRHLELHDNHKYNIRPTAVHTYYLEFVYFAQLTETLYHFQ